MLLHVLLHNQVVELDWVFVCDLVVKSAFNGLDDVGLARGRCVVDAIVLSPRYFIAQDFFVVPSRVLLLNESGGRRLVSFHYFGVVEVCHRFKELVSRLFIFNLNLLVLFI